MAVGTAERTPARNPLWRTCLLALAVTAPAVTSNSPPAVLEATEALLAGRMRVTGKPGDLALQNSKVTAVVSLKDGVLVDFWPNRKTPATSPQLGGLSDVDGLWQLRQTLSDGRANHKVSYPDVWAEDGGIRARAELALGGGEFAIETQYRLEKDQACITLTTLLTHLQDGYPRLALLDALKWGNAAYVLPGEPRGVSTFKGKAAWVGRRGASGDLLFKSVDGKKMDLAFSQTYPGLAPEIEATQLEFLLEPDAEIRTTRQLCYRPLPERPAMPGPRGRLKVEVRDEKGRKLACKLSLSGLAGTPTPRFDPDGDESGVGRFVYSGVGSFEVALSPGNYRAMVTSGYERDAATWDVRVSANTLTERSGTLPRLIETPGVVSADLHLHQVASVDADLACTKRVLSVAAEGVELAAATDHYAVTDLGPAVRHLVSSGQLARPILTMVGSEISTVGERFGHFNLIPMKLDDRITYEDTTPRALIGEMRREVPGGLIQVNHPRWEGIGYFHESQMDPYTRVIPLAHRSRYSEDFDAIEVFNGLDAYSEVVVRQVLKDWMTLIGRGHRYTATGNSDSHKLGFQDPGLPRNMIRYGRASNDEQDLKAKETDIIQALRRGNVTITSGPIIELSAAGQGPGSTVRTGGKPVLLTLSVRAVPWVDVSRVEVLFGPKATPLLFASVKRSDKVLRYETTLKVPGNAKSFVVALAKGEQHLPNVHATGVKPLAFTNPIWLEP